MLKDNDLHVIDNFISRETAYHIHNYLRTKTHKHEPDQYHPNGLDRFALDGDDRLLFNGEDNLLVQDLIKLIKISVSSYFNLSSDEISLKGMSYTNYGPTQSLPAHHDAGVSKNDVYSAILYLTDDYEGGEFVWYDSYDPGHPESNKYRKSIPDSGQLYYFNGNDMGHHEVLPVVSGERACIVFFYTGTTPKKVREN